MWNELALECSRIATSYPLRDSKPGGYTLSSGSNVTGNTSSISMWIPQIEVGASSPDEFWKSVVNWMYPPILLQSNCQAILGDSSARVTAVQAFSSESSSSEYTYSVVT